MNGSRSEECGTVRHANLAALRPSAVVPLASRVAALSIAWGLSHSAAAQSAPASSGSLRTFLVLYLLWTVPAFALIGWFRAWLFALIPLFYLVYVRTVVWPQFSPPEFSDRLALVLFGSYALVSLLVLVVAAAIGTRHRKAHALADSAPTPVSAGALPFPDWVPLATGVVAGIVLRLVYAGAPGSAYATMMAAFIYLSPLLVGAVTVYVAETRRRRTWAYYAWAPLLANVLYVTGTMVMMIEGFICAVIVMPLFALLGMIGGLAMGAICRATQWPKPALLSLAALPLVLGAFETAVPLPERIDGVERAVLINAPPERIWREIHDARDIRHDEVEHAWMYRIGVPLPQSGVTEATSDGLVRRIVMGKDIHFDQVVADWDENRYVRWTYRFAEDSFPPYALDEHVVIGGHYFDLRDTSYTLIPRGSATELRIRMTYRVSTQFNWYAVPVADLLFGNFEDVILDFYRRRSEAAPS